MQALEVSITACEGNIHATLWKPPQHTQVPHTPWLPIDVHIPHTSAPHPHNSVFLTVFADYHLTRNIACLLCKEERWFTMEGKCNVAWHSYTAEEGTKSFIPRFFC